MNEARRKGEKKGGFSGASKGGSACWLSHTCTESIPHFSPHSFLAFLSALQMPSTLAAVMDTPCPVDQGGASQRRWQHN